MKLPNIPHARLVRLSEPFDDPDWWFELKYDGFRAMAYIEKGFCQLVSRKGSTYESFEPLRKQLATIRHDVILDGEITLLDQNGRPQFCDLLRKRGEPIFYAFDCLWLDGRDLSNMPLMVRKGILEGLIFPELPLLYARPTEEQGINLFRQACEMDLEGIVAKHKLSAYGSDDLPWIKVLNPSYSQRESRRELFEKRRASVR